jgi:hypothetical protein
MAQDGYPADPKTWQSYKRIEQQALDLAALSVFTTPGAAAQYRQRYPAAAARIRVLENGYDEEAFASSARCTRRRPCKPRRGDLAAQRHRLPKRKGSHAANGCTAPPS